MARRLRDVVAVVLALTPFGAACSTTPKSMPKASTSPTEAPTRLTYGDDPSQFAELWLPPDAAGPLPVVVLIHGGFWKAQYGLDLMTPLAKDLVARRFAVLNIEYRRVGQPGGGYPGTLVDVAAAVDLLATASAPLDLGKVVFVGHSAGGHLALWAAGRGALPSGAPGASPAVAPRLAIGQGPVFNLIAGDAAGLGGGAVSAFLGGKAAAVPERYEIATPSTTAGVALAVVRGALDTIVPAEFTVPNPQGDVRSIDVPGEDHFDLIDPASASWAAVVKLIES